jgi:hypothetical protein
MLDRATSRVIALIVLIIVAAAALRGYLPGTQRTGPREPAYNSAVSLAFVAALLVISLAVIVVAVIARLREPRTAAPAAGSLPTGFGGSTGRPSWRVLLIGLTLLTAWLLIVVLSMNLMQHQAGERIPRTGSSASTRTTHGTATPPTALPKPQPGHGGEHVLAYLGASTVLLLVVLVGANLVAARQRSKPAVIADGAPAFAAPPEPKVLVRAAERGLAAIGDLNREPRQAIIACYAAMERELAQTPRSAPRDFDTASEVLARAVMHHSLSPQNASQLVNLFAEARFSSHVMTEQHREDAVTALHLVLTELAAGMSNSA